MLIIVSDPKLPNPTEYSVNYSQGVVYKRINLDNLTDFSTLFLKDMLNFFRKALKNEERSEHCSTLLRILQLFCFRHFKLLTKATLRSPILIYFF